jgi:hypothetical protein
VALFGNALKAIAFRALSRNALKVKNALKVI